MKRVMFFITLMLMILSLNSCVETDGTGSVYGIITDKETGEFVNDVKVRLYPTNEIVTTIKYGNYKFDDVLCGEYSLIVSKNGYHTFVDDNIIKVENDSDVRYDVKIERNSQEPENPDTPEEPENPEDPDNPGEPDDPQDGDVEYVDLGLSSGVKWATYNVGATRPEELGNYYAWGELEPKLSYGEDNSVTYGQNVADISGNVQYDVATARWGSGWRMPTEADFEELVRECTWKHTMVDDIYGNDIEGQMVTGPNGKSIFFPYAGYMAWEYPMNPYKAYYWTSTPDGSNYARTITFDYDAEDYLMLSYYKWYGCSIRPVKK